MDERTVTSGFLIVKTFALMRRELLTAIERNRPDLLNKGGYSLPRGDLPLEQMPKQYRGIDREPIQAWMEALRGSGVVEPTDQELAASLFLTELEEAGKAYDTFVFALADARTTLGKIEPPVEREIIWVRRMGTADRPPPDTALLGYEPTTFHAADDVSALAQGLFFSWWTREREEDPQLKMHHGKLNKWGLFDTPMDAETYLQCFLASLPSDWDEHRYTYYTTEVRALA